MCCRFVQKGADHSNFRRFDKFKEDVAANRLPLFSFIEPRYYDRPGEGKVSLVCGVFEFGCSSFLAVCKRFSSASQPVSPVVATC